jgi:hypothetical protein
MLWSQLHELATDRLAFPKIGVEVHGHEWHERTRQQTDYRNRRDRDLQNAGWQLYHFGGGELVTQPDRCVAEVLRTMDSAPTRCRYMPCASARSLPDRRSRQPCPS